MNTVTIRNVEFGKGMPKICVPIVGKTKEDILTQLENIMKTPVDIIEWGKWIVFENVTNISSLLIWQKKSVKYAKTHLSCDF